ncbi:MAG TPA: cytochrome c [Candidatus Acidoferrales bacterium]|jgi:mono/diheme cytochrome c family protein|nr:cytochrome c [Candidatus Acidoferrales bacterium]
MKGFVIGLLVGMALLAGSVYFYFVSGMAPAAVADPPMLMEKKMANKSLDAHIEKANVPAPPLQPSEDNYVAGAKIYKEQCSVCHGLPNQPPAIAQNMYPHATLMFKGKGVTDDPPQESYWKVKNGIRLTGMPSFDGILNDTQMWQATLFVANVDKLPDSAKKFLVSDMVPTAAMPAMPTAPVGVK